MAILMLALFVIISQIFAVKIVHDHDLDLWNWFRLNADILIESPYMTLFDGHCNVHHIGYLFQAICCQNLHDLDYDHYNGPRSTVDMPMDNHYLSW